MNAAIASLRPSRENQQVLRELAGRVGRAFYEPKFIVALDALAAQVLLRDDQLKAPLGVSKIKDVKDLCEKLCRDGLVMRGTATNSKEKVEKKYDSRGLTRGCFYIDWRKFIDNVKWRIMKIREKIADKLKGEAAARGFICPQCNRRSTTLEATRFIRPRSNYFYCEFCQVDLEEFDSSTLVEKAQQRLFQFTEQIKPIMDLLSKTDDMKLPDMNEDIMSFIVEEMYSREVRSQPDGELPFAADTAEAVEEIEILIAGETEEASQKVHVAPELPHWHRESTVNPQKRARDEEEEDEFEDVE